MDPAQAALPVVVVDAVYAVPLACTTYVRTVVVHTRVPYNVLQVCPAWQIAFRVFLTMPS